MFASLDWRSWCHERKILRHGHKVLAAVYQQSGAGDEAVFYAKATVLATSSGVDDCPSGDNWCSLAKASSLNIWLVRVSPGATPTTRRCGARACAPNVVAQANAALYKG